MAKPIDHTFSSATATTLWGGVKGGIVGIVVAAAIGAVVVGGSLLLGGVAVGAIGGGLSTTATMGQGAVAALSWLTTSAVGGLLTATAALVGAIGGASSGGLLAGGIGGVLGLLGGRNKVVRENTAFQNKLESRTQNKAATHQDIAMAGAQRGYVAGLQQGRQEGQEYVIGQLRAAQEQMLMQQAAAQAPKSVSHVEMLKQRAAAQQAAGPQVG